MHKGIGLYFAAQEHCQHAAEAWSHEIEGCTDVFALQDDLPAFSILLTFPVFEIQGMLQQLPQQHHLDQQLHQQLLPLLDLQLQLPQQLLRFAFLFAYAC